MVPKNKQPLDVSLHLQVWWKNPATKQQLSRISTRGFSNYKTRYTKRMTCSFLDCRFKLEIPDSNFKPQKFFVVQKSNLGNELTKQLSNAQDEVKKVTHLSD